MGTTTRGAFPYPDGTDNWKVFRSRLQALADRAAAVGALFMQGLAAERPPAASERTGTFWHSTDSGAVEYCTGSAWLGLLRPRTVRVPHTFTLSGEVKVASGDDGYVPPFYVPAPPGQSTRLVAVRHSLRSGTSATVDLRVNGAAAAGFGGLVVTPTVTTINPADVTLADSDALALVVTAVSGTPRHLSLTAFLEYTV